jgi:dTDP-glucose 4,6-dehydratase
MDNPLKQDLEDILDRTLPLWEELRGNQLFITGGTGFFGCWLLESFVWASARLNLDTKAVVLTRRPEDFARKLPHVASDSRICLVQGDVRTFPFPSETFSHVIHAATSASGDEDPRETLDTIIAGTRRTLDFAVQCRARKFLLVSSGAVYGPQGSGITHLAEEQEGGPATMDPRSAYGEGKRVAELLCAIYSQQTGLETKIARCFAFVGPYLPLSSRFAIGNFIRDALAEQPIAVRGDGTATRSYMYAADLAVWLWTILQRGKSCHPYNVGSESGLTIAEVARTVAGLKQPQLPVNIETRPGVAPGQRYVPCTLRARNELNLLATHELDDSIRRTMSFPGVGNPKPVTC